MHRLIYEMNILNINQFTRMEEPTSSILHHKVILHPFSEGGHVRICNKAREYYIKGQKQFESLGHDWKTANLFRFFHPKKTGLF